MALNFPTSPANGDQYDRYVYDGGRGVWVARTQSAIVPTATNSFATIATTSGSSPVAETPSDTLTLSAGTGITITGDSASDAITIASSIKTFSTISTPSGTSPVADSATDTLTLSAGTGITITGNSSSDSIDIATTGLAPESHTHTASQITDTENITAGKIYSGGTTSGAATRIYVQESEPTGASVGDLWFWG
jgi:hypothetical protein